MRGCDWLNKSFNTLVIATNSSYVADSVDTQIKGRIDNGLKTESDNDIDDRYLWNIFLGELEVWADLGLTVQLWRVPGELNLATFTKVGLGHFGYIGDSNWGAARELLVLAMLGILDGTLGDCSCYNSESGEHDYPIEPMGITRRLSRMVASRERPDDEGMDYVMDYSTGGTDCMQMLFDQLDQLREYVERVDEAMEKDLN
ncbi:hypothetical protein B0T14DRAFT_601478 [Immersiella caudata]|uniref:Uncharacterized protein n=1 Tax=Immersiella caudata TaxID=314043 RepID=A0AA39WWB9_9PEZI|nr:hypothetical protein B0T14DRAFT_601478 [Immersiella caudata]